MRNFREITWILTGISLIVFSFLLGPHLWVKFQANQQATQFLKQAARQDYEKAFDHVYFYNGAYDEDVTIPENIARSSWVSRNNKLFIEGTYLKAFDNLRIRMDDGWPIGTVDIVMMEKGKEKHYSNVYISFNKNNHWQVGMLQTMEEKEWEKLYSGHVLK